MDERRQTYQVGCFGLSSAYPLGAETTREAFARVNKNKHDVWIVLYPEGTRRTPKKLLEVSTTCFDTAGTSGCPLHWPNLIFTPKTPRSSTRDTRLIPQAQAFERRAGKKELDRVLFPRPKGFQATVKGPSRDVSAPDLTSNSPRHSTLSHQVHIRLDVPVHLPW